MLQTSNQKYIDLLIWPKYRRKPTFLQLKEGNSIEFLEKNNLKKTG